MVVLGDGVGVSWTCLAPALKVFAVGKASVDVVVREGDGAEALKVEIQRTAIDLRRRQDQHVRVVRTVSPSAPYRGTYLSAD